MKPQKLLVSMGLPIKVWPLEPKSSFQAWLLDAAVIMAGAWIFLMIGHILLRIMSGF